MAAISPPDSPVLAEAELVRATALEKGTRPARYASKRLTSASSRAARCDETGASVMWASHRSPLRSTLVSDALKP
jgi:hypothetical protein